MRRPLLSAVLTVAVLATGAHALDRPMAPAAGPVPTPTVTGPVTGGLKGKPQTAWHTDLAERGYVEQEYFVAGTARAYEGTTGFVPDTSSTAATNDKADYRTRVLVRRPADLTRFNGTVLVEWLNTTAQVDGDPEWTVSYSDLLIPKGWIWVGVSAQKVGVEGHSPLAHKNADPLRYANLNHPGDRYSYDMFTQVGKALRSGRRVALAGAKPQVVLATANSQSAILLNGYLSGYYQKGFGVYDGFAPSAATVQATKVPVPTIWMNSQSETSAGVSRPDDALLRVWEVAGANHADDHAVKEGVLAHAAYDGTGQRAAAAALVGTTDPDFQTREPGEPCPQGKNQFPYRYAFPAQFALLERWVRTGRPAPTMPRHVRDAAGALVTDADGNVRGGFRLPVMEVPVATYTTEGCRSNEGASVRFTEARLRQLYPTHGSYVAKLTAAVDRALKAGLLAPGDAQEMLTIARSSRIPDVE